MARIFAGVLAIQRGCFAARLRYQFVDRFDVLDPDQLLIQSAVKISELVRIHSHLS